MQIRTYLLIDQMQPQYGALTGKTMQGEIPVEGMAEIYIETAPASDIYKVMDIALKTVCTGMTQIQTTERIIQ